MTSQTLDQIEYDTLRTIYLSGKSPLTRKQIYQQQNYTHQQIDRALKTLMLINLVDKFGQTWVPTPEGEKYIQDDIEQRR